ncbi:MAG: hypothetical protein K9H61_07970, partial [Bacteroidia bacterium]|nr:hypothetical protein [Bacteroidia bacterium]
MNYNFLLNYLKRITFLLGILFLQIGMINGQTLDQSSPTNGDQYTFQTSCAGVCVIGQSFTAGVSGELHSIQLITAGSNGASITYDFTLYDGSGIGGAVLNSQTSLSTPAGGGVNFSITMPSGVNLTNGNTYTFILSNPSGTANISTNNGSGYSGGSLYIVENGITSFGNGVQDMYFNTFMNSSPTVLTSGSLLAFTSCSGTESNYQSFTVSGTNLSANLVVTAPTGFEVSTSSGAGYASFVSLSPSSGTVNSTTIYVRLTNSASGTPSGNVACTSTGATTQNVAASGTVNVLPSAPSFGSNYSNNYDGLFHLPTVTVGGGESIVWYDNILAGSVTTGIKNVGGPSTFYASAKIDATGCESSSRTSGDVTITTRLLTITADPESKTYGAVVTGGAGKTAFGSVGLQNGETIGTVTLTYTDGDEATDAVGAYNITPSLAIGGTFASSNYSITYNTGTLTVGKANLEITADGEAKTYGATITGGAGKTAFTSNGLLNGNTLSSVTLTYSDGDEATDNVGAYTITPSLEVGANGYLASNYNITYTPGALTVGQA